jgi:hypothetical protein
MVGLGAHWRNYLLYQRTHWRNNSGGSAEAAGTTAVSI